MPTKTITAADIPFLPWEGVAKVANAIMERKSIELTAMAEELGVDRGNLHKWIRAKTLMEPRRKRALAIIAWCQHNF